MTTQDMLKQVVNNLRQAAVLRKTEVDMMRKELNDFDSEFQNKINYYRTQESNRLAEAGQANSDREAADKNRQAQMLQIEESQLKSDYEKYKRDTDQRINIMQRNIDEINQMAQSVERDWYQL